MKSIRICLLICVIFLVTGFTGANFQTPAQIYFEPDPLIIAPDEAGQASVMINAAENVYGIEIHASFDPKVVQVVDDEPDTEGVQVEPGEALAYEAGFLVRNQVDNEKGTLLYAFTLLAPAPPFSGDGSLITVNFVAVGPGEADVNLDSVIISSPDGIALPLETNGLKIVSQAAAETEAVISPPAAVTATDAPDLEAELPASTTLPEAPANEEPEEASPATNISWLPVLGFIVLLFIGIYVFAKFSRRRNNKTGN